MAAFLLPSPSGVAGAGQGGMRRKEGTRVAGRRFWLLFPARRTSCGCLLLQEPFRSGSSGWEGFQEASPVVSLHCWTLHIHYT